MVHIIGLVGANYALWLEFSIFGVISAWCLVYPIIFVSTILITWRYGGEVARNGIYKSIPLPFIITFCMNFDHSNAAMAGQLALAATCAYIVGQLSTTVVYDKMRGVGIWPFALSAALIVGTVYDTIVFYVVFAFGQVYQTTGWAEMCMNGIFVKLVTCVFVVIPCCGLVKLSYYLYYYKSKRTML